MEPFCALKNLVEIKLIWSCGRNGAMCPIVNHVGSSHSRTCLQIVDSKTLTASCNMLCSYIILSESSYCTITNRISGNSRNKFNLMAIISQGYCYICLASAIVDIKLISLDKLLIVWCGQSQHNLAHGYNLCHYSFSFIYNKIKLLFIYVLLLLPLQTLLLLLLLLQNLQS